MIQEELRITAPEDQPVLPPGAWPKQGAWTIADWEQLPEDGNRYELIDGVLYVTSAPSTHHQWVNGRLYRLLSEYIDAQTPPPGLLFMPPFGVILPTGPVIPDLVYVHMRNLHILTDKRIEGVPDLLVEIAAPGTSRLRPAGKAGCLCSERRPRILVVRSGKPHCRSAHPGADRPVPAPQAGGVAESDPFSPASRSPVPGRKHLHAARLACHPAPRSHMTRTAAPVVPSTYSVDLHRARSCRRALCSSISSQDQALTTSRRVAQPRRAVSTP